jgi:hypothetical protein
VVTVVTVGGGVVICFAHSVFHAKLVWLLWPCSVMGVALTTIVWLDSHVITVVVTVIATVVTVMTDTAEANTATESYMW